MLPAAIATSLLLFCAAAAPRDTANQLGPAPVHPGQWTMPELVPGGSGTGTGNVDPSTLTTQTLAATATSPGTNANSTAITLTAADKGIPARVLTAYRHAADQLTHDKPGCHLPWELLAAIGKVESGHATGHPITDDGTITRPILGPPLNGTAGVALIHDTDNGTLDHDTTYDRAVGPMQFIPTTWRTSGHDGNNDGRNDPHNIDDATVAAGHYLCAHGRDLTNPDQLRAAILAYNPSDTYVRTVLTWMNGYRQTGATALPGNPAPPTPPTPNHPAVPTPPLHPSAPASPESPHIPEPTTPPTPKTIPGITIIPLTPRTPNPTPSTPPTMTQPNSPETTNPPSTPETPPTTAPPPTPSTVPTIPDPSGPEAEETPRESPNTALTAGNTVPTGSLPEAPTTPAPAAPAPASEQR
ncbi:lytic transglycosylase domain-containing protein [Parafrankia sp. EAN1pec]|uniref:lytic transglycosylase domain-containing protein n=1 Tax=Parafrankia sp. (strain EAN1pec) TaxID=298653 RepID=UPI0002ECF056